MRVTKHLPAALTAPTRDAAKGFRAIPARRLLNLSACVATLVAVSLLTSATPAARADTGGRRSPAAAAFFTHPLTSPLPLFTTRTYPTAPGPVFIATGLFNGNSNGADIVTANAWSDNASILLNNGNGTFGAPRNYPTGDNPSQLVVADFTGFGRRDVAVVNAFSNTVSVLICRGDGTFNPARNYATAGSPNAIEAGDFNRDGRRDLVISHRSQSPGLSVMFGNGDGTFQPPRFTPEYQDNGDMISAHLNGDGKLDLIRTDFWNVFVQLGNGDGTFGPPTRFYTGLETIRLAAGDLNGDGRQDVVATKYDGHLAVMLGNGDGTLQYPRLFYAGTNALSISLADLNNDGRLDAVVPVKDLYPPPYNADDNTVSVMFGNGDGTFGPRRSYPVNSTYPVHATVADFNRDGWRDIAVANLTGYNITVLLNNGNGTF